MSLFFTSNSSFGSRSVGVFSDSAWREKLCCISCLQDLSCLLWCEFIALRFFFKNSSMAFFDESARNLHHLIIRHFRWQDLPLLRMDRPFWDSLLKFLQFFSPLSWLSCCSFGFSLFPCCCCSLVCCSWSFLLLLLAYLFPGPCSNFSFSPFVICIRKGTWRVPSFTVIQRLIFFQFWHRSEQLIEKVSPHLAQGLLEGSLQNEIQNLIWFYFSLDFCEFLEDSL